ncbi:hypothetical protein FQS96_02090 [Enterococcus faecalis]|uniref:hypothetical protein n=1 Tax=Enterococcus TaxID=1350 RepID=UPI001A9575D4|nr:hypothetical protein [Enterococcus faecalis]MBO1124261.1 hypothetical protein [Enterococcus faecalis]
METGSIAEWVEGIAETVALIVALFLPIISERNKAKRVQNKLKRIGLRLAKKVLEEKIVNKDIPVPELNEYKVFKRYTGFVFTFNDSQNLFNTLWDIDTDLKKLTSDNDDIIKEIDKINHLLATKK